MKQSNAISHLAPGAGVQAERRCVRRREEFAAAAGGLLVPLVALPVPAVQLFMEARWGAALSLTAMFGAVGLVLWMMLRPGPEAWRCLKCGYDIHGLESGVCPECGEVLS